ncbi:hypothetical protein PSGK_11415 [Pseudomonas solani]|uniref:hypothetical protein n=1 Tax=Pseudomonas solani TaxID=2731552 RepID=UPI0035BE8DA0
MKGSECYRLFPEEMAHDAVKHEIETLLSMRNDMEVLPFMEVLDELADRQWHTYSLLPEPLKSRVEQLIILCWRDQPEITDYALSIVSKLGLVEAWEFLLGLDRQVMSLASREAIEEAETEMSSTIADPYSGMR